MAPGKGLASNSLPTVTTLEASGPKVTRDLGTTVKCHCDGKEQTPCVALQVMSPGMRYDCPGSYCYHSVRT